MSTKERGQWVRTGCDIVSSQHAISPKFCEKLEKKCVLAGLTSHSFFQKLIRCLIYFTQKLKSRKKLTYQWRLVFICSTRCNSKLQLFKSLNFTLWCFWKNSCATYVLRLILEYFLMRHLVCFFITVKMSTCRRFLLILQTPPHKTDGKSLSNNKPWQQLVQTTSTFDGSVWGFHQFVSQCVCAMRNWSVIRSQWFGNGSRKLVSRNVLTIVIVSGWGTLWHHLWNYGSPTKQLFFISWGPVHTESGCRFVCESLDSCEPSNCKQQVLLFAICARSTVERGLRLMLLIQKLWGSNGFALCAASWSIKLISCDQSWWGAVCSSVCLFAVSFNSGYLFFCVSIWMLNLCRQRFM